MVRYVHHQLITIAEAAVAMAVSASVVFAVRELPRVSGEGVAVLLVLSGLSAFFGLLAVLTPLT
ncbi:hypothetical protein [Streptomyces sp. NPDC002276]